MVESPLFENRMRAPRFVHVLHGAMRVPSAASRETHDHRLSYAYLAEPRSTRAGRAWGGSARSDCAAATVDPPDVDRPGDLREHPVGRFRASLEPVCKRGQVDRPRLQEPLSAGRDSEPI